MTFFADALPSAVVADSAPAVTVGRASRISDPSVAAVLELANAGMRSLASFSGIVEAGGPIGAKLGNGAGNILAPSCCVVVVANPCGTVEATCSPAVITGSGAAVDCAYIVPGGAKLAGATLRPADCAPA